MLKVCSFYHNHLYASSSQKKCQNSKCPILSNGLKMYKYTCALYQSRHTADAFMHNFEWLYLNHGRKYDISTFASRFYAFFCTKWYKKTA